MKRFHTFLLVSLGLALAPAALHHPEVLASSETHNYLHHDSLFNKGVEELKMFHVDKAIADFVPYSLYYSKRPLSDADNRKRLAHKLMWIARGFNFDENNRAAMQVLSIAHKLDPDNVYIKCFLSDEYCNLGKHEKSAALDVQLKPLADKDVYVCRSLIAHCNRRRDLLAARALLDKAVAMPDAKDFAFLQWINALNLNALGRTKEAIKWHNKAAENTDSSYLKKIHAATAFQLDQNHKEAERALKEAGALNPDDPTWHAMLGATYWNQEKVADARAEILASLLCKRCSTNVHVAASKFFNVKDQTKTNAFAVLDHIEKLLPWRGSIHAQRANIYSEMNEKDKARSEYKRQIELDKYQFEGYWQLSNMALKDGKPEEAFDWANKALSMYPTNRFAWEQLGFLQRQTGHPKEAAEAYLKALDLMVKPLDELNIVAKSEAATAYANSGTWAYLQAKYLKDAQIEREEYSQSRKKLNALSPQEKVFEVVFAQLNKLSKQGDEKDSQQLKEQALSEAKLFNQFKFVPELPAHLRWVKLRPGRLSFDSKDEATIKVNEHIALADMLAETERTKEAIAEYRAAIAIEPDNIELHSFLFQELQKDGDWVEAAKEDVVISQKLVNSIPGALGMGEKKNKDKKAD